VAAFLVPRVRTVAARREAGRYIRYLTAWRALERFLTAPMHANRFFDGAGARAPGRRRGGPLRPACMQALCLQTRA
jgi:hypothetical protein